MKLFQQSGRLLPYGSALTDLPESDIGNIPISRQRR